MRPLGFFVLLIVASGSVLLDGQVTIPRAQSSAGGDTITRSLPFRVD